MASGVEMLGQMSETQALAGPVQGGNMVVKPNEVPVGGAAMLAKALRGQSDKGIGGIYELPSQKAPTPEFMQMAKAGLQQGDPMRGMGPRKGLTAYDMANMAGAVEQAGVINFLGDQPEVTVPIRSKSHADAPSTQLAYITDAEKQMLLNANMHGSLEGNQPNQGPGGIQSLDDWSTSTDDKGNTTVSGGSTANEGAGGNYSGSYGDDQGVTIDTSTQAGQDKRQEFRDRTGSDVVTEAEKAGREALGRDPADTSAPPGGFLDKITKEAVKKSENEKLELQNAEKKLAVLNAKKNLSDSEKKEKSSLTKLIESIYSDGKKMVTDIFGDSEEDKKDKARIDELLKLAEGDIYSLPGSQRRELEKLQLKTSMLPGGVKGAASVAQALGDLLSKPKTEQFMDDNYLNILESEILPGYGGTRDEAIAAFAKEYDDIIPGQNIGPDGQDFGTYDPAKSLKMLLDNKGDIKEGSDLQKRLDSASYYRGNQPQTSGGLEDMVQNLTFDKIKNSGLKPVEQRRLSARLMEAREAVSRRQDNNQNRRPAVMQQAEAEVIETPDGVIDEEAQTMKYTSPRTGDKEIDVPLQRRFRTDPTQGVAQYRTAPRTEADILKYMTEGTTGEGIGLEPFSEYQRRRRKAMGLDPLELYG